MPIAKSDLTSILIQKFPNAQIKILDLAGDQDHYSIEIIDNSFAGISLLTQHKLVKAALSGVLESKLHAVTIKTKAPN